jgi:hypothetical protein
VLTAQVLTAQALTAQVAGGLVERPEFLRVELLAPVLAVNYGSRLLRYHLQTLDTTPQNGPGPAMVPGDRPGGRLESCVSRNVGSPTLKFEKHAMYAADFL